MLPVHHPHEVAVPEPRPDQRAYQAPHLRVLGSLAEITGGDDCGSLDFPIGNDGFTDCITS